MNRILMLAFFTLLSLSVSAAAAADAVQKKEAPEKSAAAEPATKPSAEPAAKPAAEPAAKPAEETVVFLDAPLFSPPFQNVPIASVDDEIIPLKELNEAFSSLHESTEDSRAAAKIDYKTILDRIINIRLIDSESIDMGLDQLPEVQEDLTRNADGTLREMLKDKAMKGLTPDKDVVDKYYKKAVKEWKIRSVIFAKEEDAKKMAAELKSGKDFNELVKKALADKTAKGGEEGQYLKLDKLLPQVAVAVEKLKAGEVTPVVKVQEGYTITKAEDIRYPDDENAKKEAEKQALMDKREVFFKKYFTDLKKKYTVINKKLFNALNFESSSADFAKLLKDKRPLVKIKDDKPVTVGEFADAINSKFFHGMERAIKEKKVNTLKEPVLDEILYKRLFIKEAKAQGIDKTDAYKNSLARYKNSLLFGVFIKKVVIPDIKVTEGESKKYYQEHIADYTNPEMLKLYSLGFYKVKDAEDTLKKLQRGDDFKWLKSNVSGQIKDSEPGVLLFDGDVFTVTGLDEGLRKALTGVKTGDNRLYSDGKFFYVINVREEIPPQKQDYAEARETTAKKVFSEKLNKSVRDWAEKLRKAHKVNIYITGIGTAKTEL